MPVKSKRMDLWFAGKVRKLNDKVADAMEDLAEEGQATLQEFIETRGTASPNYGGKTAWKRTYYHRGGGPKSGPTRGRTWSGQMHADIEQRTTRTKDWAIASFGWLDNVEDYYKEQELGFDHPATGEHIEGMFIMEEAADILRQRFRDRFKVIAREF